jgi:hypothetical protein
MIVFLPAPDYVVHCERLLNVWVVTFAIERHPALTNTKQTNNQPMRWEEFNVVVAMDLDLYSKHGGRVLTASDSRGLVFVVAEL